MISLVLIWNLYTTGPGDHQNLNPGIRRAATAAVSYARLRGERPSNIACTVTDASGIEGETAIRCRAGSTAGQALGRVMGGVL